MHSFYNKRITATMTKLSPGDYAPPPHQEDYEDSGTPSADIPEAEHSTRQLGKKALMSEHEAARRQAIDQAHRRRRIGHRVAKDLGLLNTSHR